MRKFLFLSIFALSAAPVLAEPAKCDATAFTLKKPSPPARATNKPQPSAKPAAAQPAPPKAKPMTTTRLVSDCKDGQKKPGR